MKALRIMVVVLFVLTLVTAGCSNCPLHKWFSSSDDDTAEVEASEAEGAGE